MPNCVGPSGPWTPAERGGSQIHTVWPVTGEMVKIYLRIVSKENLNSFWLLKESNSSYGQAEEVRGIMVPNECV